jgi:hypothetical protein
MRKYLVATFVACLGVLSMNAQENKSVELSQCKTNSHVTVEGHTVTSTGYGMLELPKNDYSNYTGINFDLSNFKKLEENSTNSTVALKVEYTQEDGEIAKASMAFYTTGKKKVEFNLFNDQTLGKISIDPSSLTKVSIYVGKGKKIDITNITLVTKK